VFWILGFLDEYLGRRVGAADDLISHLYCNEHDKAATLRAALSRLHEEQQLKEPPRESSVQECLVHFRSTAITTGLNSMYVNRELTGVIGAGSHIMALRSSQGMFESVGRDERLAFVAGAYYRYGRENNTMSFSNSEHTAALVADLLRELGAQDVVHETFRGFIPNGNLVRFQPTN
jgi:hypothetical protein